MNKLLIAIILSVNMFLVMCSYVNSETYTAMDNIVGRWGKTFKWP